VLDDFICSGQRLVLAATSGGGQQLVLVGGNRLDWRQVAVCSGLLSAADSSQFYWVVGSPGYFRELAACRQQD